MKLTIGRLRNNSASQILAVALLAGFPAHALAEVTTDGSVGAAQSLIGPDFAITPGLGQLQGNNLFHSFSDFNISSAESATFSGAGLSNIISRVTGGSGSTIDGALNSSATLWFINPSGVMFGPNASLNINGSLHVSTADSLGDGNGGVFYANTTNPDTVLFAGDPKSFGFLTAPSGNIILNHSTDLIMDPEETISLVGRQVTVSTNVTIPGGRLNLVSIGSVSVGSPGTVTLLPDGIDKNGITYGDTGTGVSIGSNLNVDGQGGGSIFIRGGKFVMGSSGNPGMISANTTGGVDGGGIDIRVANSVDIWGEINATTEGSGDGGDIYIEANKVNIPFTGSVSKIVTTTNSSGHAGSLTIKADVIEITGATIDVRSMGSSGNAGDVTLSSLGSGFCQAITCLDLSSTISAYSVGEGSGGNISIDMSGPVSLGGEFFTFNSSSSNVAGNIQIQGETIESKSGGFSVNAVNNGSGAGGDISINATESIVFEEFFFEAGTTGIGTGGIVTISAPSVILTQVGDGSTGSSRVFSKTSGSGYAGQITLRGDYVEISNGAKVNAETDGGGNAGKIVIDLDYYKIGNQGELHLANASIDSKASSNATTGDAGIIEIKNASKVNISGNINASTNGGPEAEGGSIEFSNIKDITITGAGQVKSTTSNNAGDAGSIQFTDVGTLTLNNTIVNDDGVIPDEISTSTTGDGDAGTISFSNTADTTISGTGQITSTTESTGKAGRIEFKEGPGNVTVDGVEVSTKSLAAASGDETGGSISIVGNNFELANGAKLLASTKGTRTAGEIDIDLIGQLDVAAGTSIESTTESTTEGAGPAGTIVINTPILNLDGEISTSTTGAGDAGTISFSNSAASTISGKGKVTSTSNNVGNAGNIEFIGQGNLTVDGVEVSTKSLAGASESGIGGSISIVGNNFELANGAKLVASTDGSRTAGSIKFIDVENLTLGSESLISTNTIGDGDAGNIVIDLVGQLDVADGTSIESTTNGEGAAGTITIRNAATANIDGKISTSTEGSGMAGNISLFEIGQLKVNDAGTIESTNTGGDAAAGDILISDSSVVIVDGLINSTTQGSGDAGDITINNVNDLKISGLISSATSDTGDAGNIIISDLSALEMVGGIISTASTKGEFIEFQGNSTAGSTLVFPPSDDGGFFVDIPPEVKNSRIFTIFSNIFNKSAPKNSGTAGNPDPPETPGTAGKVEIYASNYISIANGEITSRATGPDDTATVKTNIASGGNIVIVANNLIYLTESTIETLSGGQAGDIKIGSSALDPIPNFLIMQKSTINANAGVDGGNISIYGQHLLGGENKITATGDNGNDGQIIFNSETEDLVDVVTLLDIPFLNIASVLNNRCAVNAIKDRSSFVIEGAGLPPAPDRYAPSNFSLRNSANLPQQAMGWTNESQLAINLPIDTNECHL